MWDQQSGNLYALILAAGGSQRLGQPKQLVKIEARPLLQGAVHRAASVCGSSVVVVLGAYAAQLTPLLRAYAVSIAINRRWREGIGSSLRAGVAALPPACDGVMILLCDQVAVTDEDLRRLAGAWRRNSDAIVASQYSGTLGVPAIFPRWCFAELLELRGDRGAQALLARHTERVTRIRMPAAAIDLDTPEDLQALLEKSNAANDDA